MKPFSTDNIETLDRIDLALLLAFLAGWMHHASINGEFKARIIAALAEAAKRIGRSPAEQSIVPDRNSGPAD